MSLSCEKFIDVYWSQYIDYEREFRHTLKYITIDEDNFMAFSNTYLKLMLGVCSEVDVAAKEYCTLLDGARSYDNINQYRMCIQKKEENFTKSKIRILKRSMLLEPWSSWDMRSDKNPEWWRIYNKVKHERTSMHKINEMEKEWFRFANQQYTLNALAGLYQILMSAYLILAKQENKKILCPLPGSRVFTIDGPMWENVEVYSGDVVLYADGNMLMQEVAPYSYE